MSQTDQITKYLRGTGRELSAAQARSRFGVQNLRARITEIREAGFRVRTRVNSTGKTSYAISRRKLFD
jgi:hypothetical protein